MEDVPSTSDSLSTSSTSSPASPRIPPLPVRDGVNPTRLRVPTTGPWDTIAAYVLERFGHVDPEGIRTRFRTGEVRAAGGAVVDLTTALGTHEFIWYYRDVAEEPQLPFEVRVLHRDEHLVVADKPHFIPTTPGGRFLQNSALVRLRRALDNPDLVPLHRLDRATAGVLLFSACPETRGAYQELFENRAVTKTYEAVVRLPDHHPGWVQRLPLIYRNRMEKTKGVITARVVDYPVADSGRLPAPRTGKQRRTHAPTVGPNAASRIELLATGSGVAHLRLSPHTGRTHQLRVHLAALGTPILHDRFYPELLDHTEDDVDAPLQLLARTLGLTDPLTGAEREFRSELELGEVPR
ncbi:MAG: pseudouridine synthase [Micrococcaceae bacterium]